MTYIGNVSGLGTLTKTGDGTLRIVGTVANTLVTDGGQVLLGGLTSVTVNPNPVLSGSPVTLTAGALDSTTDPLASVSYYLDANGNGVLSFRRHAPGHGHRWRRRLVGHGLDRRLVQRRQHDLRPGNHGQRPVDQLGRHQRHRPQRGRDLLRLPRTRRL